MRSTVKTSPAMRERIAPALLYAMLFGAQCLIAEVFIPYHRYAGYLKLLTSVLLVYVRRPSAFTLRGAHVLGALLSDRLSRSSAPPRDRRHLRHDHQPLPLLLAGLAGAEESRLSHPDATRHRHFASDFFSRISFDTGSDAFSNLIAFFIIVTRARCTPTASPRSRRLRKPPSSAPIADWRAHRWRGRLAKA